MTSSIKESSVCSPDSTVSSLLTSYSIDSNIPYSNTLIHYKGKLYSSASEALEGYIENFGLSLTSSERSTGKICICQSTPKQVKFSKHHATGKHALDDFNRHVGSGFLASPSRRQSECDPDSISLVTEDLLAFPADGSPPFVQHNPLISEHQSSEWNRWSLKTSFCPCQTSSLDTASGFSLLFPIFITQSGLRVTAFFSGSTKESDGQSSNIQGKASSPQAFEILRKRHSVDKDCSNFSEQNACLDLRGDNKVEGSCNYDSPDACFPSDNSFSRHTKKPFREDQLELLTLKVNRSLESSTEDLSNNLKNDGSPTTDILGAEMTWEKCSRCFENTFSGGHHHRPLEALKLMLFKLQAIQRSLSRNETAEQKEEFEKLSETAEAELKLCDSEIIPLTNSIQKALHHLSHRKSLVEENSNQ
ncbi:LOW QUALITY PROTEIN: lung adenoma susceptibility protein 2-like [Falco naumanni]|uniref:LOW QUALITY PROTEIN: lung adenoma susceptibility protein 2-like n=1 Tax=Falco naumanni TaxID=148594 RepID=UPI001ADE77AA|nr:LOW QUALITY PROTEIN: lung adenoma susceptibility protein 2-like [Falco naumanni]